VTLDPTAPEGLWVHSFADDPWQECLDHVRAALRLPHWNDRHRTVRKVRRAPAAPTDAERTASARDIWHQSGSVPGTLGERYLNGRGLELDLDLGAVLRFHPRCPFGKGATAPALIAAFHPFGVSRDEPPTAIHRIGLKPDGTKIGKMMLGPVGGCAIKLDADENITLGIGICEGLETGLAVRAKGWRPLWAVGSKGAVRAFPTLAGIEALTIFADHDASVGGQAAARECARHWAAEGREALVRTPRTVGADWLDVQP
jgi:hypothetical protein